MKRLINQILLLLTVLSYLVVAIIDLFNRKYFEGMVLIALGILIINTETLLDRKN